MKVLLTATVQSHICQFHKPLMRMLRSRGYEIHVAARNNLAEKNGLKMEYADKVFDVPFERSPFNKGNIKAYKVLRQIIGENDYDVIHCNTPVGGILTRLIAAKYKKKRSIEVIYTAHGFHFYKGGPKLSWIVYYPIEKVFGKLFTDKLITISDADYQLAKEKHFCKKLYRIHSVGINSQKYNPSGLNKLVERMQHGIPEDAFVCICTGELNENKRQSLVIQAARIVVDKIPNFQLLLAGNGPKNNDLQSLIDKLKLEDYVHLIGYKSDLEHYVACADVAVSASLREGLGINLIEAMACGIPVIGSTNRGHSEFIVNNENGYLVEEESIVENIAEKIIELNCSELRTRLGNRAIKDAAIYLDINVEKELEEIYFGKEER